MNKHNNKLHDLIRYYMPAHYALAGKRRVQDIIDGDVEFEDAEVGAFFDLGVALAALSSVIAALQLTIQVYELFKPSKDEKPTVKVIMVELERHYPEEAKLLSDDKKTEIVSELLEYLNSKNASS